MAISQIISFKVYRKREGYGTRGAWREGEEVGMRENGRRLKVESGETGDKEVEGRKERKEEEK